MKGMLMTSRAIAYYLFEGPSNPAADTYQQPSRVRDSSEAYDGYMRSLCREIRTFVPNKIISTLAALASLAVAVPAVGSAEAWTYAGKSYPNQAAALAPQFFCGHVRRESAITTPKGTTRFSLHSSEIVSTTCNTVFEFTLDFLGLG